MAAKKGASKTEKVTAAGGAQEEKLKALEHALADLDKQFVLEAVIFSMSACNEFYDLPPYIILANLFIDNDGIELRQEV